MTPGPATVVGRLDRLSLPVACVPAVVAAVRALRADWYPVGDNAYFVLRARDVLTDHHPLLGTWTSASYTVGRPINNPGPLLFDLLAGPSRLGVGWGTVLGVTAIHLASIALGVRWARRVAGPAGAWAAALGFLALAWAMGSELLVEPWQPHSLLAPFLAYLIVLWAVAAGRPWALPWGAGLASLLVQTHLSYAVLAPGLAVVALLALAAPRVRRDGWRSAASGLARPLVVTVVVLAVAWSQPLVDQAAGEGNLATVLEHGGAGDEVAGASFAARVLASVVAVPGGWGPGGFEGLRGEAAPDPDDPPRLAGLAPWSVAGPAGAIALVLGALAIALARRERGRPWRPALVVVGAALVGTGVTLALMPVSPIWGVAAHQVRPVWPVALFTVVVVVGVVADALGARAVVAGASIVVLLLALPAHNARTGPSADVHAMAVMRELSAQLEAGDLDPVVHVDLTGLRFAEPYSTPLLVELQSRGVEFVVDEELGPQVGTSRVAGPGDGATQDVRIVEGEAAITPAEGWERIAFVAGLTDAEEQELERLRAGGEDLSAAARERRATLEERRQHETAAILVRPR